MLAADALADATLNVLAGEGEWESPRIRLAWECGAAVAEAGALVAAERVQRELHQRLKATWTVLNLTLTLSRLGAYEEAEVELQRHLRRVSDTAPDAERGALVYQSALLALGQGRERSGRNLLGRALALGSEDAVVVLGWLQLRSGNSGSARALFRTTLTSQSPGNAAWSLRGWGLSMLPRSASPAAYNPPVVPRRSAGPR